MARPTRPEANKGGRPTKRGPAVEKDIVRLLKNGNTRATAARVAGIDVSTLRRWCQRSARFRAVITQAEAQAESLYVEDITFASRKGDWQAAKFWLTHRSGDDWRPPKETKEITGADGGPLVVERVEFRRE